MDITYTVSETERAVMARVLKLKSPTAPDPTDDEVAAFIKAEFARVLNDRRLEVGQRVVELLESSADPKMADAATTAGFAVIDAHVASLRAAAAAEPAVIDEALADGQPLSTE